MAGGWPCSLPYQNYGQNKIKITDKTRGNTAMPSSDSEREAKTRKVALPYPTLLGIVNYNLLYNSLSGRLSFFTFLGRTSRAYKIRSPYTSVCLHRRVAEKREFCTFINESRFSLIRKHYTATAAASPIANRNPFLLFPPTERKAVALR